ncbi:uncharacterized protein LOC143597127 [Bidens hawaiensis]|uniref:uncharacterized protein LOC143597127 n=1 Tax=Bidens hawaiensis TaxID=980011 RepID=UPI0040492E29
MNKIERAHQMYRDGKYEEALDFYTEALSIAKSNPQKIALHSNRAACFLKLHRFNKAADECTAVLELDYEHTGALMLRAQTLVTLKEYHSALFDVNRLIELNPTSEVYQNLEARLKTQLSLAPIPEDETELEEDEEEDEVEDNNDSYEQSASLGLAGDHSHDSNEPASKDDVSNPESVKITVTTPQPQSLKEEIPKPKITVTTPQPQSLKEEIPKPKITVTTPQPQSLKEEIIEPKITVTTPQPQSLKEEIPKPKGHSRLDYSRWDKVEDDSSEDDDSDDEDSQPQYRFRVKNIGVRSVK